jgi:hypothetical protein
MYLGFPSVDTGTFPFLKSILFLKLQIDKTLRNSTLIVGSVQRVFAFPDSDVLRKRASQALRVYAEANRSYGLRESGGNPVPDGSLLFRMVLEKGVVLDSQGSRTLVGPGSLAKVLLDVDSCAFLGRRGQERRLMLGLMEL